MMPNDDLPSVDSLVPQVLEFLADGKTHNRAEVMQHLADKNNLSQEQRLRKTGINNLAFGNRIDWVRSHFTRCGIITTPAAGSFRLTDCGGEVLKNHIAEVNVVFLNSFRCPPD